jgi:hypothetical protein
MQLLSVLYRLMRCLLGLTMVLVRRDLGKDAELLATWLSTPCPNRSP